MKYLIISKPGESVTQGLYNAIGASDALMTSGPAFYNTLYEYKPDCIIMKATHIERPLVRYTVENKITCIIIDVPTMAEKYKYLAEAVKERSIVLPFQTVVGFDDVRFKKPVGQFELKYEAGFFEETNGILLPPETAVFNRESYVNSRYLGYLEDGEILPTMLECKRVYVTSIYSETYCMAKSVFHNDVVTLSGEVGEDFQVQTYREKWDEIKNRFFA